MKLLPILALVLAGCGYTTASPLGANQYAIECLDGVSYCAAKANELCPGGMDVVSNSTSRSRSTMIVKCR